VMAEICEALHRKADSCQLSAISFQDKIPFILEHCELAVALKGEKRGMLEMRRHLASYVRGQPGAAEMRAQLVRAEKIEDVKAVLCV